MNIHGNITHTDLTKVMETAYIKPEQAELDYVVKHHPEITSIEHIFTVFLEKKSGCVDVIDIWSNETIADQVGYHLKDFVDALTYQCHQLEELSDEERTDTLLMIAQGYSLLEELPSWDAQNAPAIL